MVDLEVLASAYTDFNVIDIQFQRSMIYFTGSFEHAMASPFKSVRPETA